MAHPLRVVMIIVALLMGLSLGHGLPHRYIPDDTVVRCSLGIARDLSEAGVAPHVALAPPAGKYTTYPYLLPYLDLAALGVRFVLGVAFGEWSGPGSFKAAVFENPGLAWLPGRVVSVLLGLLVPLAVYRIARELSRPKREAALAALLAGSSLMLVQYAHTVRPWAPMLGFGMASVALSLRLRRRRRLRDVAGAFAVAALAGATLQVGLAFLAVPVVGLVLMRGPPPARGEVVPEAGAPGETTAGAGAPGGSTARAPGAPGSGGPVVLLVRLVLGLATAALVLGALGYPHLLVHGAGTGSGHQVGAAPTLADQGDPTVEIGGQPFGLTMLGGARWRPVLHSWLGYEPVVVLLGLVGLALLLRGPRRTEAFLLVVAPALAFAALFLAYDGAHVRYLMPATLFLAVPAARALAALARRGPVGGALALLLLAVPLVQAARLDLLLGRADTRTIAAAELTAALDPSDVVAMDGMGSHYGPPMTSHPEPLAAVGAAGIWLNRTEQRLVEFAEQGLEPPATAHRLLPVQRFWRYDSYYPTDYLLEGDRELSDWMDGWEVDVYVQVDRLPDAERRQPVTDFTGLRGSLIYSISPTGAPDPVDASLPTDMSFPLLQLWRLQRPGPWIRAYRISRP